ncbi:UDP-glucose/GDP-mannose dehydrogenase family protein [Bacillaceae bacterium]
MKKGERIGVIGAGYVGMAVAFGFAERGFPVAVYEADAERCREWRARRLPFPLGNDPALLRDATVVFVCVGTPEGENGETDLSQIDRALAETAPFLREDVYLLVKSTVPVGTADRIALSWRERGKRWHVVSNPEFLREATALRDFLHPDRIVLGVENEADSRRIRRLFAPFRAPILVTTRRNAEMIKYAANAFLATKISFINQLAQVAEELGADIDIVAKGMGLDRRIGQAYLQAGIGFGGPCLEKDLVSLISQSRRCGLEVPLFQAVLQVNDRQQAAFCRRVEERFPDLRQRCFAVWGLSYKGGTDDIRCSPAVKIVEHLWQRGASLRVYDPQAMPRAKRLWRDRIGSESGQQRLSFAGDRWEAVEGADALLILTDWLEFIETDWQPLKEKMASPVVFDGRNLFTPWEMERYGIEYHSIGRKV